MCLQRSTSGSPLPRLASPHSGSPGVHDSTCFPSCLKAICTAKWPFLAKPTFLAEEPRPDLANTPLAQLVWTIRRHTEPLLAHRQDSLLSIHVQFGSLPETSPSSDRIAWIVPHDIRFDSCSRLWSWNQSSEHCSSRWNYSCHFYHTRKSQQWFHRDGHSLRPLSSSRPHMLGDCSQHNPDRFWSCDGLLQF